MPSTTRLPPSPLPHAEYSFPRARCTSCPGACPPAWAHRGSGSPWRSCSSSPGSAGWGRGGRGRRFCRWWSATWTTASSTTSQLCSWSARACTVFVYRYSRFTENCNSCGASATHSCSTNTLVDVTRTMWCSSGAKHWIYSIVTLLDNIAPVLLSCSPDRAVTL